MPVVRISVSEPLYKFADCQQGLDIEADTIDTAIAAFVIIYPALGVLFNSDGSMRRFIYVIVNGEYVDFNSRKNERFKEGDELFIDVARAAGLITPPYQSLSGALS